jgi:hypothetical protein
MKNIHLIETNNPSRLWKDEFGVIRLDNTTFFYNSGCIWLNIYITNNEDVDRNDWYMCIHDEQPRKSIYARGKVKNGKIIFTTNPKLIADGVQKIDDEFLEWVCKNSTCELVNLIQTNEVTSLVHGNKPYYKILIPTEKQEPIKDLEFYRKNAEENYITTPISVLRYITELEEANKNSVSIERVNKYGRHQHYVGSTNRPLVEFKDWEVK